MDKILNEIKSRYIEGKNNIKLFDTKFESRDLIELLQVFTLLKNLKIIPNKKDLEVTGKLQDLKLTENEKEKLKIEWARENWKNLLINKKAKDFFEENAEKIYEKIYEDLENKLYSISEESNEVKTVKNPVIQKISEKLNNIFKNNIKMYDTGENFAFIYQNKDLFLMSEDLLELSNILLFIKANNYKIKFAILPLYDYNDDINEDIIGINFILNIIY